MTQPRFYPQYSVIAASTATDTIIKSAGGGVLGKVIVLSTGTGQMDFQDVASGHAGTVIFSIPTGAAIGTIYAIDCPLTKGLVAVGAATNPGVTVLWS